MDIEFTVRDMFELTRPQWKLASNFEEASKAFQLAVAQDQKTSGIDKTVDQDEASSEASSDDENADDLPMPEVEGDEDLDTEDEVAEVCPPQSPTRQVTFTNRWPVVQDAEQHESPRDSESEDEAIVVTRQEEEVDPEDEAEFEREYAKMMAESLESRKFDRKPLFDIALPVRQKTREPSSLEAGDITDGPAAGTMAFSLLTKKGNRQQVNYSCGSRLVLLSRRLTNPYVHRHEL